MAHVGEYPLLPPGSEPGRFQNAFKSGAFSKRYDFHWSCKRRNCIDLETIWREIGWLTKCRFRRFSTTVITVKPVYNGPVYSHHPVYNAECTTSQESSLIFTVKLACMSRSPVYNLRAHSLDFLNYQFHYLLYTFIKFQFDLETVDEEPPRGNTTANSLLLLLLLLIIIIIIIIII